MVICNTQNKIFYWNFLSELGTGDVHLGISILFKAPKSPDTELFSFMNPLAVEIWLYILVAYILVSITIWIVARFSPYEWASPNPCEDTAGLVFQNDFTLPNSFWFAIGTLMQQG